VSEEDGANYTIYNYLYKPLYLIRDLIFTLIRFLMTELHIVSTMHERKTMMFDLSDGFIALPGGMGTIEEIFELLTWAQPGYHTKPCGILNICGYYDSMLTFLENAVDQRFIRKEHKDMLLVDVAPESLLTRFNNYEAVPIEKWIDI